MHAIQSLPFRDAFPSARSSPLLDPRLRSIRGSTPRASKVPPPRPPSSVFETVPVTLWHVKLATAYDDRAERCRVSGSSSGIPITGRISETHLIQVPHGD